MKQFLTTLVILAAIGISAARFSNAKEPVFGEENHKAREATRHISDDVSLPKEVMKAQLARHKDPASLKNEYVPDYRPAYDVPDDVLKKYLTSEEFKLDQTTVTIFHPSDMATYVAMKTIVQREPVNIAMDKRGSADANRVSYFNTFQSNALKAPLPVAAFFRTPMYFKNKRIGKVGMLNVPALAFDVPQQVHYKKYVSSEGHINPGALRHIETEYKYLAEYVVQGYLKHAELGQPISGRMLVGAYGCQAFLEGLKSKDDRDSVIDIVARTQVNALLKHARALHKAGVKDVRLNVLLDTHYLGTDKAEVFQKKLDKAGLPAQGDWEYIPNAVQDGDFIANAWDPNSNFGNGNKRDNSLDGFVGRSTPGAYVLHTSANVTDKNAFKAVAL